MTATTSPAPRLRLLPAPPHDPPYDDERHGPPPVRGNLALAFPPTGTPLPLRLVPPALATPAEVDERAPLPDPAAWTRRLAQVVMEVVAGSRPPAQLSAFASLPVLEHLEVVAMLLQRRHRRGAGTSHPVVRSVHVCHPRPDVTEASAVVASGDRCRAVALRLEAAAGRWQCTALRLG